MATQTPVGNLPTREQLTVLFKDPGIVRAFEALFQSVRTVLPDAIDGSDQDLTALTAQVNALANRTYAVITHAAATPNDRALVAGSGVSFDLTVANQIKISAGAAGGGLIGVRVITATGTYTPSAGTNSIVAYCQGGGGQGGGSTVASAAQVAQGPGGNGGAQAIGRFTTAFAGLTATIGAGGSTGIAGGAGQVGGQTSLGTLLVAPGGQGGPADTAATVGHFADPHATAATATGGNIANVTGSWADAGLSLGLTAARSGKGGESQWGTPGNGRSTTGNGNAAAGFGAGGAGGVSLASGAASAGGAGSPGVLIIFEYT